MVRRTVQRRMREGACTGFVAGQEVAHEPLLIIDSVSFAAGAVAGTVFEGVCILGRLLAAPFCTFDDEEEGTVLERQPRNPDVAAARRVLDAIEAGDDVEERDLARAKRIIFHERKPRKRVRPKYPPIYGTLNECLSCMLKMPVRVFFVLKTPPHLPWCIQSQASASLPFGAYICDNIT